MDLYNDNTSTFESLRKGFKYLEILSKFPTGFFPDIVANGNWFQKLRDFLTIYVIIIEPYWHTVQRYIINNRAEVYKNISELKHKISGILTFAQAYEYINSWNLTELELFFHSIGLPANVAFKLSKMEEDYFMEYLSSFDSTKFLENLWIMQTLECRESIFPTDTLLHHKGASNYFNDGFPSIILGKCQSLFNLRVNDDQSKNDVFQLIINRLGLRNTIILENYANSGRRRRVRRGSEIKVIQFPEIREDLKAIDSTLEETHIKSVVKGLYEKSQNSLPTESISMLQGKSHQLMDHILYESVYRHQKELREKYADSEQIDIDCEFFPDTAGGYYNPLTDEYQINVFSDLLTIYVNRIVNWHNIIGCVISEEEFYKMEELLIKYGFITDDFSSIKNSANYIQEACKIYSAELSQFFDRYFQFESDNEKAYFENNFHSNILSYIQSIDNYQSFAALCYLLYPSFQRKGRLNGKPREKYNKHLQGGMSWKEDPKEFNDCVECMSVIVNTILKTKTFNSAKGGHSTTKHIEALASKAKEKDREWIHSFINRYWPQRDKSKSEEPTLYPIEKFEEKRIKSKVFLNNRD